MRDYCKYIMHERDVLWSDIVKWLARRNKESSSHAHSSHKWHLHCWPVGRICSERINYCVFTPATRVIDLVQKVMVCLNFTIWICDKAAGINAPLTINPCRWMARKSLAIMMMMVLFYEPRWPTFYHCVWRSKGLSWRLMIFFQMDKCVIVTSVLTVRATSVTHQNTVKLICSSVCQSCV